MLFLRKTQELSLKTLVSRVASCRKCSKGHGSSADDEKQLEKAKSEKSEKSEESEKAAQPPVAEESASERLNRLLASMQTDDHLTLHKHQSVNIPRPGEAAKKRKADAKAAAESKDIYAAAKRVASLLGGEDKQQTESELLSKLLGHSREPAISDQEKDKKSEGTGKENELSLSELIVGMKIDRSPQPQEQTTRSDYVRRSIAAKGQLQEQRNQLKVGRRTVRQREAESYTGSVNLFGGEGLGIFTNASELRPSPDMLTTWASLEQHALKLQVTHPPSNYFEKLALWTEQGKVWRFPIDNEQDWSEEHNVDFSEHVFLEQHLEPWCPNRGPVRHFMELVCVGLSKNPYITAQEKKEHILWYRDYFEAKRDILKDLMNKEPAAQLSSGSTS